MPSSTCQTYKFLILASSPHSSPNATDFHLSVHIMQRSGVPACPMLLLTSRCLVCLVSILIYPARSLGSPALPIGHPNPALSAAKLNASAPVHCTSRPEWIGNGYTEQHCYSALDRFYAREALVHKGERFEWLARGQRPTARDIVWTPRAYIVGMQAMHLARSRGSAETNSSLSRILYACYFHAGQCQGQTIT